MQKDLISIKNLSTLSIAQAIFQSTSVIVFTVSSIASLKLTPNKALVTVPVAAMLLAAMLFIIPAGRLMQKYGHKIGFKFGSLAGLFGGMICTIGIFRESFFILIFGHIFFGVFQAFAQFYRFAALNTVSSERSGLAISCVTAGGVIAAMLGPLAVTLSQQYTYGFFYVPYIFISIISIFSYLVITFIFQDDEVPQKYSTANSPRAKAVIKSKNFQVALIMSCASCAIMILIMSATPLAMIACGQSFSDSNSVIQWHVFSMYASSFLAWWLIEKVGEEYVSVIGIIFLFFHCIISMLGVSYENFFFGLVFLGLGWNFIFISASLRLSLSSNGENKKATQSLHDTIMLFTIAASTFLSGAFLEYLGWYAMNLTILFLCIVLAVWFVVVNFDSFKSRVRHG